MPVVIISISRIYTNFINGTFEMDHLFHKRKLMHKNVLNIFSVETKETGDVCMQLVIFPLHASLMKLLDGCLFTVSASEAIPKFVHTFLLCLILLFSKFSFFILDSLVFYVAHFNCFTF